MMETLKKIITSNMTALVFAVVTSTTLAGYLGSYQNTFVYAVGSLVVLYLALYLFFMARDGMKMLTWRGNQKIPVSYTHVDHDWRINEQGDFYGHYAFECKNESSEPVPVLPFDDVWFNEYEKMDMQVKVSTDEKKYKIAEFRQSVYGFAMTLLSRAMRVRSISWSHIVEPPVLPGDQIKYEISIETPGTEKGAFTEEGVLAGIPVNIPTKEAKISLVAPKGFKFNLLEPVIVVDQKGTRYPKEEQAVVKPILNTSKTTLTWKLHTLITGKRYWFRYRFERV